MKKVSKKPDVSYGESNLNFIRDDQNYICLPILKILNEDEGKFRISSTSFMIQYNKFNVEGLYLITAYHCVFNRTTGEPKERWLGFQRKSNAEFRYIVNLNKEEIIKSWIKDRDNDLAILPLSANQTSRNFYKRTEHRALDVKKYPLMLKDQKLEILPEDVVFHMGYPEGLSSKLKSGLSVWMPVHSNRSYITQIESKKEIESGSQNIKGFSGGPLFVFTQDTIFLLGVISKIANREFVFENGELILLESGTVAIDSNLIYRNIKSYLKDNSNNSEIEITEKNTKLKRILYIDEIEFILE